MGKVRGDWQKNNAQNPVWRKVYYCGRNDCVEAVVGKISPSRWYWVSLRTNSARWKKRVGKLIKRQFIRLNKVFALNCTLAKEKSRAIRYLRNGQYELLRRLQDEEGCHLSVAFGGEQQFSPYPKLLACSDVYHRLL